jgi:hypothetical protein
MPDDRDLEGAFSLVTFFGQAKKVTRPPGMAGEAQQGRTCGYRDSAAGESEKTKSKWIPAFAGMTEVRPFRNDENPSLRPKEKNER